MLYRTGGNFNHKYIHQIIRPTNRLMKCRTIATVEEPTTTTFMQLEGLTEKQKQKRLEFLTAEKIWDDRVQWHRLTSEEAEIAQLHKEAVNNGHFTYDDPKLQRKVLTRLRHFLRGSCCGNACRHVRSNISPSAELFNQYFWFFQCIFEHDSVTGDLKGSKVFNSAFWIHPATDSTDSTGRAEDGSHPDEAET